MQQAALLYRSTYCFPLAADVRRPRLSEDVGLRVVVDKPKTFNVIFISSRSPPRSVAEDQSATSGPENTAPYGAARGGERTANNSKSF
jgi:hypothetical protein